MRSLTLSTLAFLLVQTVPVAGQNVSPELLKASCALYEKAYRETKSATGSARQDILVGCPGQEGLQFTTTRREDRKLFTLAARIKPPAEAAKYGKFGKNLFKNMIARTVPPEVAAQLTTTHEFRAAVAVLQSQ